MERKLARDEGWTPDVMRSVEETLPRIAKQVDRASAITARLMRVARPPGNTRTLVDVNHVVEDSLALFSYQIELAGIGVHKELGESLPVLSEDESRVGQILTNLILNAIQAMESDGGTLRVATSAEKTSVRIEVADTGQGIPPEMLQRVFEPFFTTKPVGKGTGLGLFITHRIVDDMGGSIELVSRLGKGTCSTVRLPTGRYRSSSA
jgi:two-component system NtrC family sensor kinase